MESAGSVTIFNLSIKYVKYLRDQDTKDFRKLGPYGVKETEKLECIGHTQKRKWTKYRKVRQDLKVRIYIIERKFKENVD